MLWREREMRSLSEVAQTRRITLEPGLMLFAIGVPVGGLAGCFCNLLDSSRLQQSVQQVGLESLMERGARG